MSDNNTNITNTNTNSDNNTKTQKSNLYEDVCIFGNFFGLVPDKYVKYFNLFALHITSTLIFAAIYYILFLDFNKYFFIQKGFPKNQFLNHKIWIALIMSVNFQTTTAYVDLKCKQFFPRAIITLQIISAFAITFLFFL